MPKAGRYLVSQRKPGGKQAIKGVGISNSFNRKNFFSPNDVSFLREESAMEFSHVGSSSKVNETWSLCLRRVQCGSFSA